jgi:site-specific DNA recombinase
VLSVDALAKRERVDRRSVRRMIWLGFLSPRVVEAIVEGGQPSDLTVITLVRRLKPTVQWRAQERVLGFR